MSVHPTISHSEASAPQTPAPETQAPEQDKQDTHDVRSFPSTLGGYVYLVVLAAAVSGLGLVGFGLWRVGIIVLAAGVGIASLGRAALRTKDAGMLAVRNRWFDVALLGLTAAALWILAVTVPGD
ncbi:DUF3017 family protein [Nocardioides albertanoniae]|uniref:DUF3017 family protein n=1 Tax=Nocardioides albertanoniae TaxID=1175486 RepID=A0A543AC26_9ACTN|nr:DUF3017 domain-containing protein [Nocardioides albertanoniae]TQL70152.1 DUF3017 family protein [Nocardioides albertanoniae]